MTPAEAQQTLQIMHAARQNPHLTRFLQWHYPTESLLTRAGAVYPVTAFPLPTQQQALPLDSLLVKPLEQAVPPETRVSDDSLRHLIAAAGREIVDLPTYTLRALLVDETRMQLRCALGSYFGMIDTCDALEWETLRQTDMLVGSAEGHFQRFAALLHQRQALQRLVADPLRDGSHRSVALAISVLVAYQHDGKTELLLRRRSHNVATHPGMLHVVPSFMFQPATPQVAAEFTIAHHIYREYLEEMFSLPEASHAETDWRYFYADPRLTYLQALLATGGAELHVTGIEVPLLNLRQEICAVLLIRDEEWYARHIHHPRAPHDALRINPEYAPESGATPVLFDTAASDGDMLQRGNVTGDRIAPAGAGAFWLGIDLLRRIM